MEKKNKKKKNQDKKEKYLQQGFLPQKEYFYITSKPFLTLLIFFSEFKLRGNQDKVLAGHTISREVDAHAERQIRASHGNVSFPPPKKSTKRCLQKQLCFLLQSDFLRACTALLEQCSGRVEEDTLWTAL